MSTWLRQNQRAIFFLLPAAILFSALLLFKVNLIFSVLLAIFYCVFAIAFVNNKAGLFLLIFLRPCLDSFTNQTFTVGDFSFNLAAVFAILAMFFTAYVIGKNKNKVEKAPLRAAWPVFFLASALSLAVSFNLDSGITELTRLLSILLMFYAAFILIKDNQDLARLIKVIVASAIIPSAVAIYQFFTKTGLTIPFEGVYNRVFGTFAHPNLLAFYLLLALSLCFVIFLVSDKSKMPILSYGLLAVIFLMTLVFTYTRSAWLGLMVIVLMLGLFRYRTFLIIAIVFLSLSYFSVEQINSRINGLAEKDPTSSIEWRLTLWQDTLGYAAQKPLLGYGVGTSQEIILKNRGEDAGSSDAHNDYLRVALESGMIGLIAYLALLLSLLKYLFIVYAKEQRPRLKTLSFVVLMLAISFCLISFGDNILANTALQWGLWTLFGGLLGVNAGLLKKPAGTKQSNPI